MTVLNEIAEFVARSNFGMDQQRRDLVEQAWVEDGRYVFRLDGEVVRETEGRDTILSRLDAAWERGPAGTSRHVISNLWIESCDEDTATVHYYLTLVAGRSQPPLIRATGVYRDDLVRRDGAWRWRERTLELDGPLG
jgi:SnoaL-like domain